MSDRRLIFTTEGIVLILLLLATFVLTVVEGDGPVPSPTTCQDWCENPCTGAERVGC